MTLELEMRAGRGELTLSEILTDPSLLPEEGSPDRSFLDAYFAARKAYVYLDKEPLAKLRKDYEVEDSDIFTRLSRQI